MIDPVIAILSYDTTPKKVEARGTLKHPMQQIKEPFIRLC